MMMKLNKILKNVKNVRFFARLIKSPKLLNSNTQNTLEIKKSEFQEITEIDKDKSSSLMNPISTREPEEFRSIYLENLPPDWTDDDIRIRLEQLGSIEKLHIIKNSLGERTGKVFAIYSRIDHIIEAIKIFKDKMPFMKPVKIRFFREFKQNKINKLENSYSSNQHYTTKKSSVLLIKNIPNELLKEDLKLFLSEFKEPVYIAYPRDEENEFKNIAYVYFTSIEDAEYVLKFANLRYVMNKQLFIQFSQNHYDLNDFRTRIEFGIKLPPKIELSLFQKQMNFYKNLIGEGAKGQANKEKAEYLLMRCRKLEYQLRSQGELVNDSIPESTKRSIPSENKQKVYSVNSDKNLIMINKNKYI